MKILAVDTGLGACSCAIIDGERVLAHRFIAMERGHAEALAPMVRATLATTTLDWSALDRLGVSTGPGTFTGQRVGLAFMRGLRIALKRPLIGVTTLGAMAAQAMAEMQSAAAVAIHDARREEVYFEIAGAEPMSLSAQIAGRKEAGAIIREKLAPLEGRAVFCGTAAEAALSEYRALGGEAELSSVRQPDALWVARLALEATADEVPQPLYLRPPDAKLPKPKA